MTYELVEVRTGKRIATYATEGEALRIVGHLVRWYGEKEVAGMGLVTEGDGWGTNRVLIAGEELVRLATDGDGRVARR